MLNSHYKTIHQISTFPPFLIHKISHRAQQISIPYEYQQGWQKSHGKVTNHRMVIPPLEPITTQVSDFAPIRKSAAALWIRDWVISYVPQGNIDM